MAMKRKRKRFRYHQIGSVFLSYDIHASNISRILVGSTAPVFLGTKTLWRSVMSQRCVDATEESRVTRTHATLMPLSLPCFHSQGRTWKSPWQECQLKAQAFFYVDSVFDSLLYRPPNTSDISEYSEVQRVLREEIVNPLRKNLFVRADKVMKLRKFLDHLSSVTGLMSEEKGTFNFLDQIQTDFLTSCNLTQGYLLQFGKSKIRESSRGQASFKDRRQK